MVVRLKFDVKAGRAIRMMREQSQRARDLRTPFRKAADQSRRKLRGYFNRRGDGEWDNLQPVTKELRGKHQLRYRAASTEGPSQKILHWTHRLRNSLTQAWHSEHISRFQGRMIYQFGTSVPYARWHQDGRKKTRGAIRSNRKVPKRRPLPDQEGEFIAQLFVSQVKMHFGIKKGGA